MDGCRLCPRECNADRQRTVGFCGESDRLRIARAALHMWEEPPISGTNGSGAVFFTGCSLKCVFCQNYEISSQGVGKEISIAALGDIFLKLQGEGAHNINLVGGGHFAPQIIAALDKVKNRLTIPVVLNSGGYESLETLKMLEGYINIYLPDFKYKSAEASAKYSACTDYFERATVAIAEMQRQAGSPKIDKGIMKSGVVIRHMVLPTLWRDSCEILDWVHENLPKNSYLISLMSQYTPCFKSGQHIEINRRVTSYEYNKVLTHAQEYGMGGFMQDRRSAKQEYTPAFDFEGL